MVETYPGHPEVIGRFDTVKFNPGVLPWMALVGMVGVHLFGADQEALSGFDLVL